MKNTSTQELEDLVEKSSMHYILACVVTESAAFLSTFHAKFLLQDADLVSVCLKATSDKSWSLSIYDSKITRKSVTEWQKNRHVDFLDPHLVATVFVLDHLSAVLGLTFSLGFPQFLILCLMVKPMIGLAMILSVGLLTFMRPYILIRRFLEPNRDNNHKRKLNFIVFHWKQF